MSRRRGPVLAVLLTALALGPATPLADAAARQMRLDPASPASASASSPARVTASLPLAGIKIALDPGHQLGNHNFPAQISRLVPAGGFRKPCNTTGTATNGGFAEATFTFELARAVAFRLRSLGAQVVMTRTQNSESLWGPCVDVRGRFGQRSGARLTVSLHGDGAAASDRGFQVIYPTRRSPWTTDIYGRSLRLARALRAGLDAHRLPRSTYAGGGTGLVRRSDLATLNLSDVPVAMIECGNMRNASDARRMRSVSGRAIYAAAVVAGIRRYLNL
jgi:N-acetylmuramoyl-L-alanine amidase